MSKKDFDKVLARQRPTVSKADLDVHERFTKEYGEGEFSSTARDDIVEKSDDKGAGGEEFTTEGDIERVAGDGRVCHQQFGGRVRQIYDDCIVNDGVEES
ncbi:unnamed protein product [Fraxinus pennsylvanica]|uniref:Spastin/Vps4 C-terminal domain-containing protein n=1 Tax=Fraxinus pennsylvanica TaxID=56036 RepID=A0AAD1ZKD8_9LAMI|nr:unnamed protein product [Fraxinus pennsylvanica]